LKFKGRSEINFSLVVLVSDFFGLFPIALSLLFVFFRVS